MKRKANVITPGILTQEAEPREEEHLDSPQEVVLQDSPQEVVLQDSPQEVDFILPAIDFIDHKQSH